MAIREVKNDTEIKVGQWVLQRINTGLCGMPRQVTKITKSQYHFTTSFDGETRSRFYLRSSLRYVCDTEEEGNKLYEISERCYKAENAAAAEARRQHIAEITVLMQTSAATSDKA